MASATKDAITLDKLSIKAKKYYDQVAAPRARACGCDAQHWGTQPRRLLGPPVLGVGGAAILIAMPSLAAVGASRPSLSGSLQLEWAAPPGFRGVAEKTRRLVHMRDSLILPCVRQVMEGLRDDKQPLSDDKLDTLETEDEMKKIKGEVSKKISVLKKRVED